MLVAAGTPETSSQQAMYECTGLRLLRWRYIVATQHAQDITGQGRAGQGMAGQGTARQGRAGQNIWDRRIMWGFASNKAKAIQMFRDDTNTVGKPVQTTTTDSTPQNSKSRALSFLAKPILTTRQHHRTGQPSTVLGFR